MSTTGDFDRALVPITACIDAVRVASFRARRDVTAIGYCNRTIGAAAVSLDTGGISRLTAGFDIAAIPNCGGAIRPMDFSIYAVAAILTKDIEVAAIIDLNGATIRVSDFETRRYIDLDPIRRGLTTHDVHIATIGDVDRAIIATAVSLNAGGTFDSRSDL